MTSTIAKTIIEAAKRHARAEYPKESCGLVVGSRYIACENIAANPLTDFEIDPLVYAEHTGKVRAVLHSHPDGPIFPTDRDMAGQMATNVIWGIIALDDERVGEPTLWGPGLPIPPILGRQFVHGVTDCYSLIRDAYRLGREALAEQGIADWPFEPIELPDFVRADSWWKGTDDFYQTEPSKLGFRRIKQHEARPGDVFLLSLRSDKLNHGGLLVGNDLIVHHLPGRLSRREPAGLWGRQAERWIRYEGPRNA